MNADNIEAPTRMGGIRFHLRSTAVKSLLLLTCFSATSLHAQQYPTGPVRIVVPFPAGEVSTALAA